MSDIEKKHIKENNNFKINKQIIYKLCIIIVISIIFTIYTYNFIEKSVKPPLFYGLSNITVDKNSNINYNQEVIAKDGFGKELDFKIDTSKVDIGKAGTYFAIYIAEDDRGNITNKNRKVIINYDQEDVEIEFYKFINEDLANLDVLQLVEKIRNGIEYSYEWGEDDPIWFGLKNKKGNCYVHAIMVKKALDLMGIENQLIHTEDKTHYWNLVKIGNIWRHYDSTPGEHIIGPATDKEKIESTAMQGRKWDTSKWPKAQ